MKIDFNKRFRSISNTCNGEVDENTIFEYFHEGDIVAGKYHGGSILQGQLLAKVLPDGRLDVRYHHINKQGQFMAGECLSTPEILADGRLKLKEDWKWLTGDKSSGHSEIVEVLEERR